MERFVASMCRMEFCIQVEMMESSSDLTAITDTNLSVFTLQSSKKALQSPSSV